MRGVAMGITGVMLVAALGAGVARAADGVRGVDEAWIKAMKANDLEAVMACYAPDAVAWLPGVPEAKGLTAIRAVYTGLLSANRVQDATFSDTTYHSMGSRSVGWGRFSILIQPKAGGALTTLTGRFTEVAELRGKRWVYVVDHASDEPAPSAGRAK